MSKQHNTAKRNDQEEIKIPETDLTSAEVEDGKYIFLDRS